MNKKVYFGILIFLFLGCFSIGIISNYKDWISILTLIWIIWGSLIFRSKRNITPTFAKIFTSVLIISTLISFISASKNYDMSFVQSFITNRQMFLYLAIPVIFKLGLTDRDIFKVLKILFIISFGAKVIEITLGINILNGKDNYITSENIDKIGIFIEGMPFWILLSYYLVIQWFENIKNKKMLLFAILGSITIVSTFNRGLTIPFLILIGVFYITKAKRSTWFIGLIMLIVLFLYMKPIIENMLIETQEQLNDNNYARNSAIEYFIFKSTPGPFEYIFGNSMIGKSTEAGAYLLKYRLNNLFNLVDLGWIGFYHLYGIFPIIVYVILFLRIIFSHTSPTFLKMLSIHMLFPIGWNMWMSQYMLTGILAIYLFFYYKKYPNKSPKIIQKT